MALLMHLALGCICFPLLGPLTLDTSYISKELSFGERLASPGKEASLMSESSFAKINYWRQAIVYVGQVKVKA